MKRALALLEQTKATMPHLPRPVSGLNDSRSSEGGNSNNDSDAEAKNGGAMGLKYRKAPKRNPSASNRKRIFATTTTAANNNNNSTTHSNSDIHKVLNSNAGGELSSRKSTAVSTSTNRVGSSGGVHTTSLATESKRGSSSQKLKGVQQPIATSLAGGSRKGALPAVSGSGQYDARDIIGSEKEKPVVYELSLKSTNKPKPHHKLKPLGSSKMDNKANSVLEIENAYQREVQQEIMNDIDKDLQDFFDTGKLFSQMQNAFGEPTQSKQPTSINPATADYLKKQKKQKQAALPPTDSLSSSLVTKSSLLAKNEMLDPIIEEGGDNQVAVSGAGGQLVVYEAGASSLSAAEQRARKNEALKKKVKMATGGVALPSSSSQSSGLGGRSTLSGGVESSEAETFITGTKIAAKESDMQVALPEMDDKMQREYEAYLARKKTKHYKYEEDELLDDLEQHEHDMNEMLKYLTEVEELVRVGQDLKSIEQMMQVTRETMDQHMQACDKFKGSLSEIEAQAETAIKILNFYHSDGANIDGTHSGKGNGQLQRVMEEDEGDSAEQMDRKNKPSQEKSKSQIVDQLGSMNDSMRQFTSQLESRLDRAYRTGATKKFGYEGLTSLSNQTAFEDGKKEERALNKIHSQASQFVAETHSKSQTPSAAMQSMARKNSQVRALPPSQSNANEELGGARAKYQRKGSVKSTKRVGAGSSANGSRAGAQLNSDLY